MAKDVGEEQVEVGKLVLDEKVYPRTGVSTKHIEELVEALKAGDALDALGLIIEAGTYRIVDGVHRWHAYRRVFGAEYKVNTWRWEYANDAELFVDAVRSNATHGRRLEEQDVNLIIQRAEGLSIDLTALSSALSMTKERLAGKALLATPKAAGRLSVSRPTASLPAHGRPPGSGTTGASPHRPRPPALRRPASLRTPADYADLLCTLCTVIDRGSLPLENEAVRTWAEGAHFRLGKLLGRDGHGPKPKPAVAAAAPQPTTSGPVAPLPDPPGLRVNGHRVVEEKPGHFRCSRCRCIRGATHSFEAFECRA